MKSKVQMSRTSGRWAERERKEEESHHTRPGEKAPTPTATDRASSGTNSHHKGKWHEKLQLLVEWKATKGTQSSSRRNGSRRATLSSRPQTMDSSLAEWVCQQRQRARKGEMSEAKRELFELVDNGEDGADVEDCDGRYCKPTRRKRRRSPEIEDDEYDPDLDDGHDACGGESSPARTTDYVAQSAGGRERIHGLYCLVGYKVIKLEGWPLWDKNLRMDAIASTWSWARAKGAYERSFATSSPKWQYQQWCHSFLQKLYRQEGSWEAVRWLCLQKAYGREDDGDDDQADGRPSKRTKTKGSEDRTPLRSKEEVERGEDELQASDETARQPIDLDLNEEFEFDHSPDSQDEEDLEKVEQLAAQVKEEIELLLAKAVYLDALLDRIA